jgi:hypothetical protein
MQRIKSLLDKFTGVETGVTIKQTGKVSSRLKRARSWEKRLYMR